jgi:hypothetical protein
LSRILWNSAICCATCFSERAESASPGAAVRFFNIGFSTKEEAYNETDDHLIGDGHIGHRDFRNDTVVRKNDAENYGCDAGSDGKGARGRENVMKQFIVLIAMLALGFAIYGMIAGSGEDSMLSTVKNVWAGEIELRTREP